MQKESHPVAIKSFNSNHQEYSNYRLDFSKTIVDPFLISLGLASEENGLVVYDNKKTILELAAGSGKFTKTLIESGWGSLKSDNLVIVEPSEGMLQSFREKFPDVPNVFKGSSYNIPLADNSIDVVLISQGFHWFADLESLQEISRVLRQDGKLGLIWHYDYSSESQETDTKNIQYVDADSIYFKSLKKSAGPKAVSDQFFDNQPWSVEVTKYIYSIDLKVPQYRRPVWREALKSAHEFFNPIEKEIFAFHEMRISPDDVFKYWGTRSYITDLDQKEKDNVKQRVNEILKKHMDDSNPEGLKQPQSKLIKPMGTHAVIVTVKK